MNNEGLPAPESIEAQALKELEGEGFSVETTVTMTDEGDGEIKDQKVVEPKEKKEPEKTPEPKEETPKAEEGKEGEPKEPKAPSMTETWRYRISEQKREQAEIKIRDLERQVADLSKQSQPISASQKQDLADDIKAVADEAGINPEILTKFAENILAKAGDKAKIPEELTKVIEDYKKKQVDDQNQKLLSEAETEYSNDFDKVVAPFVKEKYKGISDAALSEIKAKLKDVAFTEQYGKVELLKVFKAEEDVFDLKGSKQSSEGEGLKPRFNGAVDPDNIDEEAFKNLPDAEIEKIMEKKTSSNGWK